MPGTKGIVLETLKALKRRERIGAVVKVLAVGFYLRVRNLEEKHKAEEQAEKRAWDYAGN
jgi:hypothetical protein